MDVLTAMPFAECKQALGMIAYKCGAHLEAIEADVEAILDHGNAYTPSLIATRLFHLQP